MSGSRVLLRILASKQVLGGNCAADVFVVDDVSYARWVDLELIGDCLVEFAVLVFDDLSGSFFVLDEKGP